MPPEIEPPKYKADMQYMLRWLIVRSGYLVGLYSAFEAAIADGWGRE